MIAVELAKKAQSTQKQKESLLHLASIYVKNAEASEAALKLADSAKFRMKAAVCFYKAGEEDNSRVQWGNAADMLDMTVHTLYQKKAATGFLSRKDLMHLADIITKMFMCCNRGRNRNDLYLKYMQIDSSVWDALDGSYTIRPESLLKE